MIKFIFMETKKIAAKEHNKIIIPIDGGIVLSAKKFNDIAKFIYGKEIIDIKTEKMLYEAAELSKTIGIDILDCSGRITQIGKLLLDREYTQARHEITCFDTPTKNQLDFIMILELFKDGEMQLIKNEDMELMLLRRSTAMII